MAPVTLCEAAPSATPAAGLKHGLTRSTSGSGQATGQLGPIREADAEAETALSVPRRRPCSMTEQVHRLSCRVEPAEGNDVDQEAGREDDETSDHDGDVIITYKKVGIRHRYAKGVVRVASPTPGDGTKERAALNCRPMGSCACLIAGADHLHLAGALNRQRDSKRHSTDRRPEVGVGHPGTLSPEIERNSLCAPR